MNSDALLVPSRSEAEPNLPPSPELVHREEVAAVELGTVSDQRVDLARRIRAPHETGRRSTRGVTAHDDDISFARGPLALNTDELIVDAEDEVTTAACADRREDLETQPRRIEERGGLRNGSFLVTAEHDHPIIVVIADNIASRSPDRCLICNGGGTRGPSQSRRVRDRSEPARGAPQARPLP